MYSVFKEENQNEVEIYLSMRLSLDLVAGLISDWICFCFSQNWIFRPISDYAFALTKFYIWFSFLSLFMKVKFWFALGNYSPSSGINWTQMSSWKIVKIGERGELKTFLEANISAKKVSIFCFCSDFCEYFFVNAKESVSENDWSNIFC